MQIKRRCGHCDRRSPFVVTFIWTLSIKCYKNVSCGSRVVTCIWTNITKLLRTCPQFSSLTCQKVWTYMDVSNGIRTTDPHIISIHGFVDIMELSFPALALILSICPRTGNWVAVCIVYCSLSLRNDDRPVTFLQAISPTETVADFSGARNGFWKKTKNNYHIESCSPDLNRLQTS
jgi:hypothetical protein